MDYVYLTDFFAQYSLPTLIIAVIVWIIMLLIERFLSNKISASLRSYLPFALATLFYLVYEMIFVSRAFAISMSGIYAGILCGSLSIIISSIALRIKKGKPLSVSQTILLIEGIISGYVRADCVNQTAKEVQSLLLENAEKTSADALAVKIKENSLENLPDDEFIRLAQLILTAVYSKNKAQK